MSKVLQRVFLAAFVILDLVLVIGAIRHVNGTPPASVLPDIDATTTPKGDADAAALGSTSLTQLPYDFSASMAVTISSANDGTIVFGSRGSCADPEASVKVSTNGGDDFATSATGLTTTLAVRTTGAKSITVVGTDAQCETQQVTSTNGGSTWATKDDIDLWYPDPEDATGVVSPRRNSQPAADCVVTSISQVTADSARVSCVNGSFYGSGDAGSTWVQLGRLDNVRVSTFLTPSAGYALARFRGCAASAFTTVDGGATWTPGGCISGEPAQAISATSNALAAIVDGEPFVSTDGGKGWRQP